MGWTSVHKALCILTLLTMCAMLLVDYQLARDTTGFHLKGMDTLITSIMVFTYLGSAIAYITAYRYVEVGANKPWLFWLSLPLLLLGGLVVFVSGVDYLKDILFPRPKSIFDALHLFDSSEKRQELIKYQNIIGCIWALLQLATAVTLIRLKFSFKKNLNQPSQY